MLTFQRTIKFNVAMCLNLIGEPNILYLNFSITGRIVPTPLFTLVVDLLDSGSFLCV